MNDDIEMPQDLFHELAMLRKGLDEANKRLSEMQTSLFGDSQWGRQGMIEKQADHERRIQLIERTHVSVWQLIAVVLCLIAAGAIIDGHEFIHLSFEYAVGLAGLITLVAVVSIISLGVRR